jgi:hypothetical protein
MDKVNHINNPLIFLLLALLFFLVVIVFFIVALVICISVANLVLATLGVEVQNETIANKFSGNGGLRSYLKLIKTAIIFVVGFIAGMIISPSFIPQLIPNLVSSFQNPVFGQMIKALPITVFYLILLWLFYERFFVLQIFATDRKVKSARISHLIFSIVQSGLLLILFTPIVIGLYALFTSSTGRLINPARTLNSFYMSILIVTIIYCIAFGMTWFFTTARRLLRRSFCPNCGKLIQQRFVVGQNCGHCGQSLSPWLFIEQPT